MAKYYGAIGFGLTTEVRPGVWVDKITERMYPGDLVRSNFNWQNSGNVNDDLNITNQISIVADKFAESNVGYMKYAKFMGSKWKITGVSVEYPRMTLTLGGLYNDNE